MNLENPVSGPGLISVDVTKEITQQADRADLLVAVSGSSLVMGRAALRQAREVADLVAAATSAGVVEDDIELLGVEAEQGSAGGRMGRTSARYDLRVRCRDLARLTEVLGAVTAQRNTRLDRLDWGYPDPEAARNEAIRDAIQTLRQRAAVMAEAMGVQVLGVHTLRVHTPDGGGPMPPMARSAKAESLDLGMNVAHSRALSVHVSGELRISDLAVETT